MTQNPESPVIDAITELVNKQLAHAEDGICSLCGDDRDGHPGWKDCPGRHPGWKDCPGDFAADEEEQRWLERPDLKAFPRGTGQPSVEDYVDALVFAYQRCSEDDFADVLCEVSTSGYALEVTRIFVDVGAATTNPGTRTDTPERCDK